MCGYLLQLYNFALPSDFKRAWYWSLISLLNILPDGVLGIYTTALVGVLVDCSVNIPIQQLLFLQ